MSHFCTMLIVISDKSCSMFELTLGAGTTVINLSLHVPGIKDSKVLTSECGTFDSLEEFSGMLDPCDPNLS